MLRSGSAFLSFPPLSFSSCFAKIAEIHRVVSNFLFVLSFSLSVSLCLCLTGRLPESLFLPVFAEDPVSNNLQGERN